jgi:AcrR family transcriptional regulator
MVTMSTDGGTRRRRFRGLSPEERTLTRRAQLIEAGLEAFGTRGFHAVGVRDICAEAHLTERYFYESFENREALFLAVYEHAVRRIRQAVGAAIADAPADISETSRRGIRALLETLRGEPRLARIVLIDVLTVGSDVGNQSMLVTRAFADVVLGVIERFYPDLPDQGLDPRLIAEGLVGSTLFIVMQWAFTGFKESVEHLLEHSALLYDATARALSEGAPKPVRSRPRSSSRAERRLASQPEERRHR